MFRPGHALFALAFGVVALTACKKKHADEPELPTVAGNGVTASESRTLPPFTRLVVNGALALTVSVGKDAPLELHGDANLFAHVKSSVVGNELTLEPDAVLKPAQTLKLELGVARLDELGAAVAAKVTLHGVKSDALTLRTGGAGQITADGSATQLTASARSVSRLNLGALSVSGAHVAVADFARLELGYVEKLDATQRGMGVITYLGTPELTTHAERSSNVAARH